MRCSLNYDEFPIQNILIFDGSFITFKYLHTRNRIITSMGEDIYTPYRAFKYITSVINEYKPLEVHIVFDVGRDIQKKKKAEYYKKSRGEISAKNSMKFLSRLSEDKKARLANAYNKLVSLFATLPVKVYTVPMVEGDTIIAKLAVEHLFSDDNRVLLVSGDKDFLQLAHCNNLYIYKLSTQKNIPNNIWTKDNATEILSYLFGKINDKSDNKIKLYYISFFRSLAGDPSDNIPGVKGFGKEVVRCIVDLLDRRHLGGLKEKRGRTTSTNCLKPEVFFESLQKLLDVWPTVNANAFSKKTVSRTQSLIRKLLESDEMQKEFILSFELCDLFYSVNNMPASAAVTVGMIDKEMITFNKEQFVRLFRKYEFDSKGELEQMLNIYYSLYECDWDKYVEKLGSWNKLLQNVKNIAL